MDVGHVLAGRFVIERLAGSGGMAVVYRALDRQEDRPVAVKVLRNWSRDHAARFAREAEILAELSHPGIVRHVSHGSVDDGTHYLVMEWLEGETLSERVGREMLSVSESLGFGLRAAEALGQAHRSGVIHRDIKPSNFFLVGGSLDAVKVLDFGIARRARVPTDLTATGTRIGTPSYMAPEQARGDRGIDARADIFALGCVLFRCLTGRVAFEGDDGLAVVLRILLDDTPRVGQLRSDVSPAVEDLIARMLAKAPARRPADMTAVARELEALRDRAPDVPASTREPPASLGLTTTERRSLCIVLARTARAGGDVHDVPTQSVSLSGDAALREAIASTRGSLEILADGSMLVSFEGGEAATDLVARAARAALAITSSLGDASVALVSGRGVRGEHLPPGEVIDRAVRVLFASAPGVIRLDATSAALLDDRFDVRRDPKGPVLRGVRAPGQGRRAAESPRTLLGKPTPCIGRDVELGLLEAMFNHCVSEPVARVALVTGAPGIGKSRLRYEFIRRLQQRTEQVGIWMARGDPMSAGSAFHLAAHAVRRTAGLLEGEPLELRQEKLQARVGRHVPGTEQARVTEFLGELVSAPFADEARVQLRAARQDGILMGDQIRRAWVDFVAAECRAAPLVIVLEDLHWGDLPTLRLVDAALRSLAEERLLVIGLARPEIDEQFPELWGERGVQLIRLAGLTRRAGERLVKSVLGPAVSDEETQRLVQRAGGNAFYLEELIRGVAEGGDESLPETVLAMVEARLAGMETEARRVLRAASIFGERFWGGGVEALLGGAGRTVELAPWLDELCRREVISRRAETALAGQEEYVFRHALVREAAYAMLTEEDRALGHRLAASFLENAGETDPMLLAEHFERGQEPARAVGLYRRAAEQALEGNDFASAIDRAERGARSGATGEALAALRRIQGEAFKWSGNIAEASRRVQAAVELSPEASPPWYGALADAGVMHSQLGHFEGLVRTGEQLRDMEGAELTSARCAALARVAGNLVLGGNLELAAVLLASVEPVAASGALDPAVRARLHQAHAFLSAIRGDFAAYLETMSLANSAFEQAGDGRSACQSRVNIGYAYSQLGAYAAAEQVLREGLAVADGMGLRPVIALAKNNLGWVIALQGRLVEGRRLESEAVDAFRTEPNRRLEGGSRGYLAQIFALSGDLDAAEREARAATRALESSPPLRAYANAVLSRVLLARGQAAAALEQAREAIGIFDTVGVEEGEALVHLAWMEALDASGDREAARAASVVARDRLTDRAAKIADPTWRERFLRNVPEHARTFALAAAWT